ncbi:MAG TPA: lysylphosphatidylglycerol synthase transmembrane domain-containing protein [Cyclobacteriaceae bacterium]|nr:lysylphosphatidylglycerol synthase transmembrane domain-containing protein [Cyclobacteriaceae bacterium]
MQSNLKAFFQYVLILAITGFLVWFSLRGLHVKEGENKWEYIYHTWQAANKGWLLMMATLLMFSHVIRAERWRMLMKTAGQEVSLKNGFLSLLVGYLVNLVIPRGGEVSRCYNLYKLDHSPVEVSFGTVVVERLTDLLCLVLLLVIAFAVESEKLFAFIGTLPIQTSVLPGKFTGLLLVAIAGVCSVLFFLWLARKNQKLNAFLKKTIAGFKQGLSAVFKLERKSLYILYSIAIWVLYFLMSYCVILAFKETSHLGLSAVLSLFAIGSIAMAAPLPGGTGSYHALVPAGLVFLYQIPHSDAVAFTFVFHGWQTFNMMAGGAVALLITSVLVKKKRADS